MDCTLLIAVALGALGVFLLLPRAQASWRKLGALITVLVGGGGLFYLSRWAELQESAAPAGGLSLYFYIFAAIAVGSALAVISHPKPLYAALYFVILTLATSALLLTLYAEFIAIVLIVIYAGAILVTYVFVIMLASTPGGAPAAEYDKVSADPLIAVLVSFLLLATVLQLMFHVSGPGSPGFMNTNTGLHARALMAANLGYHLPQFSGIKTPAVGGMAVLGRNLYSHYALSLELAGVLLTVAMVGAVVISRKNEPPAALGSGELPTE